MLKLVTAAWVATAALLVVAGVLAADQNSVAAADVAFAVEFGAVVLGMATLGVLIARKRPGNPIGWLFTLTPFMILLSVAGGLYADSGHPGATLTDGLGWTWVVGIASYALYVPLLFPDGKLLPGRRWKFVARVDAAVIAGAVVGIAGNVEPVAGVFLVATLLLVLVSVASMVVRYRRAQATERLQLKWVLGAAIAALAGFIGAAVLGAFTDAVQYIFIFAYALVPLAIAIAILRYRLYEIDVIIRRTLTYSCLVIVLAAVYLGGVTVIGALLRNVTGASSALAVTVSTLAAAAAFQPLRRRIREHVDHRFARRAYDAQHAASEFSGRLREQIDLDALSDELLAVVGRTVQPATASVWLRPPESPRTP